MTALEYLLLCDLSMTDLSDSVRRYEQRRKELGHPPLAGYGGEIASYDSKDAISRRIVMLRQTLKQLEYAVRDEKIGRRTEE